MKRLIVVLMISAVYLSGCQSDNTESLSPTVLAQEAAATGDTVETAGETAETIERNEIGDEVYIKEKMFIEQINDIYLNADDYLGKTIRYEGMFNQFYWEDGDQTYYSVIRYGPGCCSFDANAGFEIKWDGEYPETNDWVEVSGTLEEYEEDGTIFLQLVLDSMTVLDQRGAEDVD